MTNSDGERVAPVTYLFGSAPAHDQQGHSPTSPPELAISPGDLPAQAAPLDDPRTAVTRAPFDRISNVSMYALARRGMSAVEMRDYLIGREFEVDEVELECDRLRGVGLLDDFALAETLARTLSERKGLGRGGLVAELRRRKLDQSAITEALESRGDDELDRAIAIAEKRAPQLRSVDHETAKRRLGAFLMRKGYSGAVVSTAVARALTPSGPVFR